MLPHMAPLSLVPGEHFVLKDLPFYEVAHLADLEARQAHLEEREKKCQEGMLRQGPAASRPASSSIVRPPAKTRKGPAV